MVANYLFAALIGAIAGSVELLKRYRDAPWATLGEPVALLYVLFNAAASALAYHLAVIFDVRFGVPAGKPVQLATVQVLVAGLAAIAFFRTTLFTVKTGDSSLAIGPSVILEILLTVTDRTIDRGRALPRAADVPVIMDGVDFAMAAVALPAFCFGTMQNVSSEEQTVARAQCDIIAKTELSNVLKCNLLGLLLVNLVGKAVLERAVRALGDEIRAPLDGFDFERAAVALPAYCFATAQNVTAEVQKAAVAQIELLRATDLSNALKCKLLGLTLIEIVGRPAVERAIRTLGAEIRVP